MAETVTRQLREPFVEAAGMGITNEGLRLLKDKIDTSQFTGRQFVADESALEQQAEQLQEVDSRSRCISRLHVSVSKRSY